MKRKTEYASLLNMVQEHISANYSAALNNSNKVKQLYSYIEQFLNRYEYEVEGYSEENLVKKLYSDMAEYSVLTPFLGKNNIEEININAWNDIAITYTNGKIVKLKEHFLSPTHATDIVKRLLQHSGMIIDNAAPMSQGHLPNNTRITALKAPIVDEDIGVSVSIRLLHPSKVNKEQIISSGNATRKMVDFLCMCIRYGVSMVVAGATSSGKTTLLNALLNTIPDNKRVFTIESGSRELSLVRKTRYGNVTNNVVHTLSRPSENEVYDISQEDLVVASLRFNPDIVCVGEMRDVECYAAVEASLTGHTVVSTVHAFASDKAHMRIANLCQKRYPTDTHTALMQAGLAFPLVVYTHKLDNNERKIMDISECEILPNGERKYHTLFRYHITRNEEINGKFVTEGYFEQPEIMSDNLQRILLQFGVPHNELTNFLTKGADYT